ncbi:MAG: hypothetical protein KJ941_09100 [Bacteroidetes bacterium]|nr:hypothetical protein [Bacteroidota bacterium]
MKFSLLFLTLTFLCSSLLAQQRGNFNTSKNWTLNKKEIMYGIGATNFLGDLGGRNQIGTDYSLVDFDLKAVAMTGQLGYRYRFKPKWATTTTLYGGIVRGNDQFTEDHVRESRNLSFRSPIISLSQRAEFLIATKEAVGGRYRIPGVSRMKDRNFQFYVFAGVGLTYFNPQAELNGKWYNLREFHTEGQGLEGGPRQYRRFTFILPGGIGIRTGIGKLWRVGLELSLTKTFSDYIDDVSGNYYDPEILRSLYGDDAAYFSNPSVKNQNYFAPGFQRGDKQKDSYLYANIVFYKNLTYKPARLKYKRTPRYKTIGRYKF